MTLIADILLVAAALGAGIYCFVLARRLKKFNDLEKGVGGAVAVLSTQVDDLNATLNAAQELSRVTNTDMRGLVAQAETVAKRLELMMASMHDLPEATSVEPTPAEDEASTDGADGTTDRDPSGLIFLRHDRRVAETGT